MFASTTFNNVITPTCDCFCLKMEPSSVSVFNLMMLENSISSQIDKQGNFSVHLQHANFASPRISPHSHFSSCKQSQFQENATHLKWEYNSRKVHIETEMVCLCLSWSGWPTKSWVIDCSESDIWNPCPCPPSPTCPPCPCPSCPCPPCPCPPYCWVR